MFTIVLCLVSELVLSETRPQDASREAEIVIDANQSLVGGIRTYYAHIEMSLGTTESTTYNVQKGEYWRSGDDFRLRVREPNRIAHHERKKGKGRITSTARLDDAHPDPARGMGIILVGRDRKVSPLDAWELSLLNLPVSVMGEPALPSYTLRQAATVGRVTSCEPTTLLGRSATHLTIELPKEHRTYDVWCSLELNGLILKTKQRILSPSGSVEWDFETTVEELAVVSPELSLPRKVRYVGVFQGKGGVQGVATLTNIIVNGAAPKWPAFPTLAAGSHVMDEVNNTVFTANSAGGAIAGTTKPIAGRISPAMPITNADASGWSPAQIALVLLSISLSLAVCGLLLRRRRSGDEQRN